MEGLGPWGPVVFLLVVMICEMVPLFPTQPLSLASGLLFGAVNVSTAHKDASCVVGAAQASCHFHRVCVRV